VKACETEIEQLKSKHSSTSADLQAKQKIIDDLNATSVKEADTLTKAKQDACNELEAKISKM